jgi:hypothetical protein
MALIIDGLPARVLMGQDCDTPTSQRRLSCFCCSGLLVKPVDNPSRSCALPCPALPCPACIVDGLGWDEPSILPIY